MFFQFLEPPFYRLIILMDSLGEGFTMLLGKILMCDLPESCINRVQLCEATGHLHRGTEDLASSVEGNGHGGNTYPLRPHSALCRDSKMLLRLL